MLLSTLLKLLLPLLISLASVTVNAMFVAQAAAPKIGVWQVSDVALTFVALTMSTVAFSWHAPTTPR
jgi:hypothetical protein